MLNEEARSQAITNLELAYAQKAPTMQAEHAIDDRTGALGLYDCIIPALKEHRKYRFKKDEPFSIEDFKAQLELKRIEMELQRQEVPQLRYELEVMKRRKEQLESQVEVVRWYLDVMEKGADTRTIIKDYADLRVKYDVLEHESGEELKVLRRENKRLKRDYNDSLVQL